MDRVWLLINQKITKLLLLKTVLLAHVNPHRRKLPALKIPAHPLTIRLAVFVEAFLSVAIESIHHPAIPLRPPLLNPSLSHTQYPVLLRGVAKSRINLTIRVFLERPKLDYSCEAGQAGGDVVEFNKLILIRIQHLLVPVRQIHLAQLVETLDLLEVLRVGDLVENYPNIKEIRLALLLQHIVQPVVPPTQRRVRLERHDLLV